MLKVHIGQAILIMQCAPFAKSVTRVQNAKIILYVRGTTRCVYGLKESTMEKIVGLLFLTAYPVCTRNKFYNIQA